MHLGNLKMYYGKSKLFFFQQIHGDIFRIKIDFEYVTIDKYKNSLTNIEVFFSFEILCKKF